MKILELAEIIPDAPGGSVICHLQKDGNDFQTHRLKLDKRTFDNLEALVARFPNCRFRLSPSYEEVIGHSIKRGTVSVIHVQWIQHVSFYASPSFFAQIEALFDSRKESSVTVENVTEQAKTYRASSPPSLQEKPDSRQGRRRYMPGLDGLRALAILAVIAYHLHLKMAPGGFLGVTVFFVLSGYLITDLLAAEWARTDRINLKSFWFRRAKRLLPAVLSVIGTVLIWMVVLHPDQLLQSWGVAKSALFYVSNWWLIFHNVSYFEQFGLLNPLGHLWSLGVEEQFYLLWPFLVVIGLKWMRRTRMITGLVLTGAMMSAFLMFFLYQPGYDPSRVYYGTDTRAFSLLVGAALAFVWPSREVFRKLLSFKACKLLDIAGAMGLASVILMIWKCNEYQAFLYHGGMFLLSALTAVTIAAAIYPGNWMGRLLGWTPLRWLGKRSYGIYLWHYPIIVLTTPIVNTGGVQWVRAVLQVAACIVIAALSWKFLEEPILHGEFLGFFKNGFQKSWTYRFRVAAFAMAFIVLTVLGVTVATADDEKGQTGFPRLVSGSLGPFHSRVTTVSAPFQRVSPSGSSNKTGGDPPKESKLKTAKGYHGGVTIIGDSVLLDVKPYLKKRIPGIVVNGEIGRQMRQAQAILRRLKRRHQLKQTVVIELGTNGAFSKQQLSTFLKSLNKKRNIFLINTRVPRPWQGTVNKMLSQAAKQFPNVNIINWFAESKGKASYFTPDGVHLTALGAKDYAKMIADAVAKGPSH